MNDVARRAKVSSMTVSRVLSHPEEVREKTRERVMRVIRETGYRKDIFASNNSKKRRSLSREKTILINCRMENLTVSGEFAFYSVVYFALMKGIL
ncbi:MAG: LacI family DNA-binding transcriptional regulator, partial [Spirochaetia bacterium]|nr:LacI family DNA-binding transcriptional regulator [Spirochaetia bacterium]